jgi:HSP20 family protein
MAIVHYEPWSFVDRLARQFEQFESNLAWIPSVDVQEENERFVVRADLPGVNREDIEITAEDGVLSLRGVRKGGTQEQKAGYQRIERVAGTFVRRFTLPKTAQAEAIKASYVDGVLEVSIPKQPKPESRRIKVEAA